VRTRSAIPVWESAIVMGKFSDADRAFLQTLMAYGAVTDANAVVLFNKCLERSGDSHRVSA